jgi:sugar/nucleoside kinase (ribokinase family)
MGGVLVVGESLVDIVRTASGDEREYAGGSAANAAVALARLGRPTRLATSFATDDHGRLLRRHLERGSRCRQATSTRCSGSARRSPARSVTTSPLT